MPAIFVVDFLAALVLLMFALVKLAVFVEPSAKASIETAGVYAIQVSWPGASEDDIDMWVRSPAGGIVNYNSPTADLVHLEHDDLGKLDDEEQGVKVRENRERVVLRGILPGEYVINLHAYRKTDATATTVLVELYALRGPDRVLSRRRLTLTREGEEETAFRFTPTADGGARAISHLPRHLLG